MHGVCGGCRSDLPGSESRSRLEAGRCLHFLRRHVRTRVYDLQFARTLRGGILGRLDSHTNNAFPPSLHPPRTYVLLHTLREYNNKKSTQLPVWNPVEAEDCSMCAWSFCPLSPSLSLSLSLSLHLFVVRSAYIIPAPPTHFLIRCEYKALAQEAAAEVQAEADAAKKENQAAAEDEHNAFLTWLFLGIGGVGAGIVVVAALVLALVLAIVAIRKRKENTTLARRDSLDSEGVVMSAMPADVVGSQLDKDGNALPAGWVRNHDEEENLPYYTKGKRATWTRPQGKMGKSQRTPRRNPIQPGRTMNIDPELVDAGGI